jgi:hypothetical protein
VIFAGVHMPPRQFSRNQRPSFVDGRRNAWFLPACRP